MASVVDKLMEAGHITPPRFVKNNIIYEVVIGSQAYGSNLVEKTDFDMRAVSMTPKDMIFPHLIGYIDEFGPPAPKFKPYVKHHIAYDNKQYDLEIIGIVRYFHLCMENNPDKLDMLFVPQDCITAISQVGHMIRDARHLFLHKGCYQKFRGYAVSQLSKMSTNKRTGVRADDHAAHGFDTKFACHLARLLLEVEQLLLEGDLDLRRNKDYLKSIRRGEVSEAEIRRWAADREHRIECLYQTTALPAEPRVAEIKALLLKCLEHHYGSLSAVITTPDRYQTALLQIRDALVSVNM